MGIEAFGNRDDSAGAADPGGVEGVAVNSQSLRGGLRRDADVILDGRVDPFSTSGDPERVDLEPVAAVDLDGRDFNARRQWGKGVGGGGRSNGEGIKEFVADEDAAGGIDVGDRIRDGVGVASGAPETGCKSAMISAEAISAKAKITSSATRKPVAMPRPASEHDARVESRSTDL